MVTFRQATVDDALFIARGFQMAMLMENVEEEQTQKFAYNICTRDDVLYSAPNTIIAEVDGKAAGMITAYDGSRYHEMRQITLRLIEKHLGITFPGMEDEAGPGEYYLDSLAVWPEYRGKGIGRQLLQQAIATGLAKQLTVTLAVDPVNENAQRLYRSLGFEEMCDLFIFGHTYWKWCVR